MHECFSPLESMRFPYIFFVVALNHVHGHGFFRQFIFQKLHFFMPLKTNIAI